MFRQSFRNSNWTLQPTRTSLPITSPRKSRGLMRTAGSQQSQNKQTSQIFAMNGLTATAHFPKQRLRSFALENCAPSVIELGCANLSLPMDVHGYCQFHSRQVNKCVSLALQRAATGMNKPSNSVSRFPVPHKANKQIQEPLTIWCRSCRNSLTTTRLY